MPGNPYQYRTPEYWDWRQGEEDATADYLHNKSETMKETQYYIDYVHSAPAGEPNFYHTLVRRRDGAILYANPNLDYVKLRCWYLGILREEVTIL